MKTILKLDLKFLLPIAGLSFMYFNNAKYSVFTLNFWDAVWKLAIWHAETMPTNDHPVPLKYAISLLRYGKIEHWQAICPMDSPLQKSGWNSGMQLNFFCLFVNHQGKIKFILFPHMMWIFADLQSVPIYHPWLYMGNDQCPRIMFAMLVYVSVF